MSTPDYHDEIGASGLRFVNELVIHCSASKNGDSLFTGLIGQSIFRTPVEIIDAWHAKRGFHRSSEWRERFNPRLAAIGYHLVIYTSGCIETGRHMDEIGAHVAGSNAHSIGICMIGTDQFKRAQWESLASVVFELEQRYKAVKNLRVLGHRDLSPDANGDGTIEPREWLKTCPGFDVASWLKAGRKPDPKHVYDPAPPASAMKAAA